MNIEDFLRTIYLGDRACKAIEIDGWEKTVRIKVDCISRLQTGTEAWNYYTDEDVVDGFLVFREVERVQVRAAQTLGANRYHIFRDVALRSAFPFIIVGARLGMSMAFIVLVAAELIASSAGLGFMISDARYNFRTDQIFVGMACIGVLGFALNMLLLQLERSLLKWKSV